MPDSAALRDRFHFYVWNGDEVRLMCSWDTTGAQVDEFLDDVVNPALAGLDAAAVEAPRI